MRYLFYENCDLVAELDKCTVVSAADSAGVTTLLFNGKTYRRRKPIKFGQEWVAFDLVEHATDSGQTYHVNDGVGEDSPAMNPSVRYFRGQVADRDENIKRLESDVKSLRHDKDVANGLIANLEALAAADGEKIRDLESRLETVAASRERSIDDYNKSVAREGRLREEIQRINLRLADAEHERVRAVAVESELRARLAVMEEKPFIGVNLRDYDAVQFELRAMRDELVAVKIDRDRLRQTVDAQGVTICKIQDDLHLQRASKDVLAYSLDQRTEELAKCDKLMDELRDQLAEVEHQRDDANKANAALRDEADAALKERDQWRRMTTEARRERDAAVKRADGLLVNLRSVKQMVAGIE